MRRPRLFWRIYRHLPRRRRALHRRGRLLAVALGARLLRRPHRERAAGARGARARAGRARSSDADTPGQLEALVRRLGDGLRHAHHGDRRRGPARRSRSGTVLADARCRPAEMENHSDRPEFQARLARRLGHGRPLQRRRCDEDMMYVAVPVTRQERSRVPSPSSAPPCRSPRVNDALGVAVLAHRAQRGRRRRLLAALIGLFVSRRISRQMREITAGRRALRRRRLQPQAARAAHGGVRRRRREPQPHGRRAGREDPHAHPRAQRARGRAVEHGRGRARRRHRRARDRRSTRRPPACSARSRSAAEGHSIQEVVRNPDLQHVVAADAGRSAAGRGRHRDARRRRGPHPAGQRHAAARRGRTSSGRRRRRAQRRDAAQAPRGGAPRLRRQRLARAQDAGHLHQGLRRDAAGRRRSTTPRPRAASCASSPARPTA